MTLAKAKAKTNVTIIVQASLMIVTYDCKNMFIVQATVGCPFPLTCRIPNKKCLIHNCVYS